MRLTLVVCIELERVWDDDDLTLADHLRGMADNYPSVGALVGDAGDVSPDRIATVVTLERDGETLTRPWPDRR